MSLFNRVTVTFFKRRQRRLRFCSARWFHLKTEAASETEKKKKTWFREGKEWMTEGNSEGFEYHKQVLLYVTCKRLIINRLFDASPTERDAAKSPVHFLEGRGCESSWQKGPFRHPRILRFPRRNSCRKLVCCEEDAYEDAYTDSRDSVCVYFGIFVCLSFCLAVTAEWRRKKNCKNKCRVNDIPEFEKFLEVIFLGKRDGFRWSWDYVSPGPEFPVGHSFASICKGSMYKKEEYLWRP